MEIESRPGPDGEERLRRLFTLLVKLASDDEAVSLRKGPWAGAGKETKQ